MSQKSTPLLLLARDRATSHRSTQIRAANCATNDMNAIAKQAFAHKSHRMAMAFGAALLGSGCDLSHAPVLDPKGPIALAERTLLLTAVALMLIVVIPVIVRAFLFAWRYRSSNGDARYTPDWSYSARIDAVIWLVSALIVISLGVLLWSNTHKLIPTDRSTRLSDRSMSRWSRRTGSGCSSTPGTRSRSSTSWCFPAGRR